MAEKIRDLTGKKRCARSTVIKDKDGNILSERNEVLERWKEYVEELYGDEDKSLNLPDVIENGPPITRREIEHAAKKMKWKKAEGSDGVEVDMLEAAGDFAIDKLQEIANKIYSTGHIPDRMYE